jgi:hypothetical protein
MNAILFIECEKRKENFDYTKELTEDEYVAMLRGASDSILGLEGFRNRDSLEQRYGIYDINAVQTYQEKNDIEKLPFKANLYTMNGDELTMQHISYFWNSNQQFIVILEVGDIDNPMVEDTLNIWVTNSDHINNDKTLNDRLILSSLQPKDFEVKINNIYFTFKYCKMVDKINTNKFAILVNNIEK